MEGSGQKLGWYPWEDNQALFIQIINEHEAIIRLVLGEGRSDGSGYIYFINLNTDEIPEGKHAAWKWLESKLDLLRRGMDSKPPVARFDGEEVLSKKSRPERVNKHYGDPLT